MITPSLRHILRRVAETFCVTKEVLRGESARGDPARLAFSYLASGMCGGGILAIGMQIGRSASFVAAARDEAALRRETDAAFSALLWRAELDVLAECGVADRFDYPLPRDFHAAHVARQLVGGQRAALSVNVEALTALGAAYLALAAEAALLRTGAALLETDVAARAFVAAEKALGAALYTPAERSARRARDAAFNALSTLFGDCDDKAQQKQNPGRKPARAAE